MDKKRRREYTLNDVTVNDARMLLRAAAMPEKTWFCFGVAFYKLDQLELIDEDLRPTYLGKAVANKIMGDLE